jgi:NADPH:quinone reductase-like Zn-dependent oxidoreductase
MLQPVPPEPRLRPICTHAIEINRPPREVFDFVIDRRNYHRWFPGIVEMRPIDDLPVDAVGKRYAEIARLPTGALEQITPETVLVDPPNAFAMDVDLKPVLPRFRYSFLKTHNGGTNFLFECHARGEGPLTPLGRFVMNRVLGVRAPRALVRLKTILEEAQGTLMRAAEIRMFGDAARVFDVNPVALRPEPADDEVLVRVVATSVNPIETKRRAGYGRVLLAKKGGVRWPIVLGADFAGIVETAGRKVNNMRPGEAVFGAKEISSQGALAEFICVKAEQAIAKPDNVSFSEAAALSYVFLTAWSALVRQAGLRPENARGKKILIQAGSGGVGGVAVQLAKAWGAEVATTCRSDGVALCRSLGADRIFNADTEDFTAQIEDFDIAFDTVGGAQEERSISVPKPGGVFVTIIHPLLQYGDDFGFPRGLIKALAEKGRKRRAARKRGVAYHWATFAPDAAALSTLADLVSRRALRAQLDRRFSLDEVAAAHRHVEAGRALGKTIIDIDPLLTNERSAP